MSLLSATYKVGWGNAALMVEVATGLDPNEIFPDKCKPELIYEKGGLVLRLLNRPSGFKWSRRRLTSTKKYKDSWQMAVHAKYIDSDVPRFGLVKVESVERIVGGLLLRLPTNRPEVKAQIKGGKPKASGKPPVQPEPRPQEQAVEAPAPAVTEQPQVEPSASPVENLQVSQPAAEPVGYAANASPSGDLLAAVDTVNQWKDYLGDKLVVSLGASGKIGVLAQHGEQ